jgi:pimeloyl-ACP methyl ester carboxylesterase
MQQVQPFIREAGNGPGVVCIHANASTSSQWRGLIDLLSPRFHMLAPDCYGAGSSPDWHSDRIIALNDEVEFLERVFARAGSPLMIVGHSYGAAVALRAALANPQRVRALALFEPSLFAVVDADRPPPNGADGIRETCMDAASALDRGDIDAAAERFIDYWMEDGAWRQTPANRQAPIAASMKNVRRWAHALFTEPTPLTAFAALTMPVLYMVGTRSRRSAHAVAELLVPALPRGTRVEFEELGHMGPVTHPGVVNEVIAKFLDRCAAGNS